MIHAVGVKKIMAKAVNSKTTTKEPLSAEQMEIFFNLLTDYTDKVSLINSVYESDLETAFQAMEGAVEEVLQWDTSSFSPDLRLTLLSYLTFHRETVWEIIQEARSLLMSDRREYVKRLVNHHKEFIKWLSRMERNFAA
mgnify:FL=1